MRLGIVVLTRVLAVLAAFVLTAHALATVGREPNTDHWNPAVVLDGSQVAYGAPLDSR